jgi:hypothetical protein
MHAFFNLSRPLQANFGLGRGQQNDNCKRYSFDNKDFFDTINKQSALQFLESLVSVVYNGQLVNTP